MRRDAGRRESAPEVRPERSSWLSAVNWSAVRWTSSRRRPATARRFMSSGQNVAVKGTTFGYYLFKRNEALRGLLPTDGPKRPRLTAALRHDERAHRPSADEPGQVQLEKSLGN
jgi:hypothetical protein